MDDGLKAILLIISVLLLSYFFFVMYFEGLYYVFLVILTILSFLLLYTCIMVIASKLDKHKVVRQWNEFEEMEKIKSNNGIRATDQKNMENGEKKE